MDDSISRSNGSDLEKRRVQVSRPSLAPTESYRLLGSWIRPASQHAPGAERRFLAKVAFVFLWLFVFTMPSENVMVLPGLGTMGRIVGLVAFGVGVLGIADSGRLRAPRPAHVLMALFVLWCSLTYFWSAAPELTLERILTYVQLLAMVWLLGELAQGEQQQIHLMQAYVLGVSVASLSTIIAYLTASARSYGRYAAVGHNPNETGLRLALSLPIALYLAAVEHRRARVWLYRLQVLLALWAISLTASRGAFMATLAALLFAPLASLKLTFRQKVTLILVTTIVVFTAVRLIPEVSWKRLSGIEAEMSQGTMNLRTVIWQAGVDLFRENPFQGVGAGAYGPSVEPALAILLVAHNTFLSVLVEEGLIGFGLFLLLILELVLSALQMPHLKRSLWLVLLLTWAVGASAMTWEQSKPTWFLFGLLSVAIASKTLPDQRHPVRCAFLRYPISS